jgi:hypothetical protein
VSDFPRGWVVTLSISDAAIGVRIPPLTAIVRVIDTITLRIANTTATSLFTNLQVLSDDSAINLALMAVYTEGVTAPSVSVDSDTASGLDLAFGPAQGLNLATSGRVGVAQFIRIQGHDI